MSSPYICTVLLNWILTNIISIAALLIAGITAWFNFWRKPEVNIYLGETINFVCNPFHDISGFHLHCTFINPSPKTAVVTNIRLHFKIYNPDNNRSEFEDEIKPTFYVKHSDNLDAEPSGPAMPLMIKKVDSIFQSMQFDIPALYHNEKYSFLPNRHTIDFELFIWINDKNNPEKTKKFRSVIDSQIQTEGNTYKAVTYKLTSAKIRGQAQLCPIPIQILK